jgi:type IV pilus assembly protein PilX
VLIVALLFLVILTILGVTAMSATTMEERMSGNTRDTNIALQAAEAALRDARRDIMGVSLTGLPRESMHQSEFGDAANICSSTTRGLCRGGPVEYVGEAQLAVMPPTPSLDTPNSASYGSFTGAPEMRSPLNGTLLARQPLYMIENFCLVTTTGTDSMGERKELCKFYRITARGWGVNPNSQVTLQEMFDGS